MKKVKLQYPIIYINDDGEEGEIRTLKFGRIKLKHLKKLPDKFFQGDADNLDASETIPFIAALSGITIEQAEEIDLEDLNEVMEGIAEALGKFLETGEK